MRRRAAGLLLADRCRRPWSEVSASSSWSTGRGLPRGWVQRTMPFDPSAPIRGRYVRLGLVSTAVAPGTTRGPLCRGRCAASRCEDGPGGGSSSTTAWSRPRVQLRREHGPVERASGPTRSPSSFQSTFPIRRSDAPARSLGRGHDSERGPAAADPAGRDEGRSAGAARPEVAKRSGRHPERATDRTAHATEHAPLLVRFTDAQGRVGAPPIPSTTKAHRGTGRATTKLL